MGMGRTVLPQDLGELYSPTSGLVGRTVLGRTVLQPAKSYIIYNKLNFQDSYSTGTRNNISGCTYFNTAT